MQEELERRRLTRHFALMVARGLCLPSMVPIDDAAGWLFAATDDDDDDSCVASTTPRPTPAPAQSPLPPFYSIHNTRTDPKSYLDWKADHFRGVGHVRRKCAMAAALTGCLPLAVVSTFAQ